MGSLCVSNFVSKETRILLIRLSLFGGFLYGGAFLFMTIEEEATKEQIEKNKVKMEILKNMTMDKYNMTDDEFGILVNKLKTMACANLPEWSFKHATSFTLQLLTTIAAVSQAQDGWSIRQGAYVWFITLTTVGFGDFVPKIMMEYQPNDWIIPGLCFMAAVVDSMVEFVNKADFQLNRDNSKCLCCNNSLQSAQMEGDGTRKLSSNDLGLEEAHQQRREANSSGDTKF